MTNIMTFVILILTKEFPCNGYNFIITSRYDESKNSQFEKLANTLGIKFILFKEINLLNHIKTFYGQ